MIELYLDSSNLNTVMPLIHSSIQYKVIEHKNVIDKGKSRATGCQGETRLDEVRILYLNGNTKFLARSVWFKITSIIDIAIIIIVIIIINIIVLLQSWL